MNVHFLTSPAPPVQFQILADKHAPSSTGISDALASLQIPAEPHSPSLTDAVRVPLPLRTKQLSDSRYRTALLIRNGRRASQQLAALVEASKASSLSSHRDVFSHQPHSPSSMRTELEQDFTVEGRKGALSCPFSRPPPANGHADMAREEGHHPDHSEDPICAAMSEATGQPLAAATPKCPIRYLDRHSPEEIARYVETHKHEIPRSHEICVSRYRRNEEDIRKLDAKYGSLVNMVQGLSQLHKPMLPRQTSANDEDRKRQWELDRASNERVESWAQEVSASAPPVEDLERADGGGGGGGQVARNGSVGDLDNVRVGNFERSLKEIRVGESPSRPWGISVPVGQPYDEEQGGPPMSPPPAPVVTPAAATSAPKCPFDFKFASPHDAAGSSQPRVAFSHDAAQASHFVQNQQDAPPSTSLHEPRFSAPPPQPVFINPSPASAHAHTHAQPAAVKEGYPPQQSAPQMLFTGPVFIGYPMEQALQLMNQWKSGH